MKITFESSFLVPSVSETISLLTNSAKVHVDDIQYDEENGNVEIPMQRKEITEIKKTVLGTMKPVYGQASANSLLTIRQVDEMEVEVDDSLRAECNSCFTVLFGLKIDNNQLYLGSVEESKGKILCQIRIKVKELSIEFTDVERK